MNFTFISVQVTKFVVFPNKICLPLVDFLAKQDWQRSCHDIAGVLRVKMICAANLQDRTGFWSVFHPDRNPYAVLKLGPHSRRLPTRIDTANPSWNITHDFPVEHVEGQQLLIELFDDYVGQDEFLGRVFVQTSVVAREEVIEDHWMHLEENEDGDQVSGQVKVSLSWLSVVVDSEFVKTTARTSNLNDTVFKALVHIYIDSCKGIITS